jgi:hypothetical protein
LYDGSYHEAYAGQERVVANGAQPAGAIAQEALVFGGSKFGDPIVLSGSCR